MIFKKTYTIDVEIDLEKAHNDSEWAVENWEVDHIGDLLGQIQDDVDDFIKEKELN